jgi:hypothetical protein
MKTYSLKKISATLIVVIATVVASCFMVGCQKEDTINNIEFSTYLSLGKSDFDFARDWDNLSETDKNTFLLAHKRMDFTFDDDGICTTKWTSGRQVNMSDELFNCFTNMIALTNEATRELSEAMPEFNIPRLKSGNECNSSDYNSRINSCAVKSIYNVYNALYSSGISYTSIDGWICANDYYAYSSSCNCWGIKSTHINTVLSHFLKGGTVTVNVGNLTNSSSIKCILILKGTPLHAVVYNFYNTISSTIQYYDPQGSGSGYCSIEDVLYIFKAIK